MPPVLLRPGSLVPPRSGQNRTTRTAVRPRASFFSLSHDLAYCARIFLCGYRGAVDQVGVELCRVVGFRRVGFGG